MGLDTMGQLYGPDGEFNEKGTRFLENLDAIASSPDAAGMTMEEIISEAARATGMKTIDERIADLEVEKKALGKQWFKGGEIDDIDAEIADLKERQKSRPQGPVRGTEGYLPQQPENVAPRGRKGRKGAKQKGQLLGAGRNGTEIYQRGQRYFEVNPQTGDEREISAPRSLDQGETKPAKRDKPPAKNAYKKPDGYWYIDITSGPRAGRTMRWDATSQRWHVVGEYLSPEDLFGEEPKKRVSTEELRRRHFKARTGQV
jgi:hypothetical protein